jgi:undecaprenyl-diphosphatase
MALITVPPTAADVAIAKIIASRTTPPAEGIIAEFLTWGADEHVLSALTAAWWLYTRGGSIRRRRAADHVLLVTLAATVLPHLLKVSERMELERMLRLVTILEQTGRCDDA